LRDRLADVLQGYAATRGVGLQVDNDAKALALGEGWLGAAKGERNYLAMVVSTGVGGGIVLGGRLLGGATGNAGHIGHVIVEPDGRACACGARGCLEAEASGTAIARATGAPAEAASAEVIERTGLLVGRAVGSVANLLDLRLAVVAGSVALGFGTRFFLAAQREVDRVARLSFSSGCRLEPAGLDEGGPIVGAAALGWCWQRRSRWPSGRISGGRPSSKLTLFPFVAGGVLGHRCPGRRGRGWSSVWRPLTATAEPVRRPRTSSPG
jgi:glucokinase